MNKVFRTGLVTVTAAVTMGMFGAGSGHADTGSAGGYAPPAPVYTLLPHGVIRIEAAPGASPTGWWCGGASFNPPAYVVAPKGAPLPQDLQFPPGSTVDIDCSSGTNTRARAELQTLP
ncbi:hypothetical protein ACW2Q0_05575 [Nocardia sp. R16R-3T]